MNNESDNFYVPTGPPVIDKRLYNYLTIEDENKIINKSPILTDITPLLNLSQKTASSILGISESMLCKKFKEITNKKWPYRDIQKIDKLIDLAEDPNQVQDLQYRRKQFFTPISIYVKRYYTQKEAEMLLSDKRIK